MRIRPIAVCAVLASLISAASAESSWFCRKCSENQTAANRSRNVEAAPPPHAEAAAPLAISSSGLESEIQARINEWAAKGITPGVATAAAAGDGTQTVTVKVGGQTLEITITVKGSGDAGGPAISGDLAKDLQAAYARDAVLLGDKAKFKDNLVKVFTSLATTLKSNAQIRLGNDPITNKKGLDRVIAAELLNFAGGGNLPLTQAVIRKHLSPFLTDGATALSPDVRSQIAAECEKIAAALSAVK